MTTIDTARRDELPAALRLLFRHHGPDAAATRADHALRLIERGDFPADAVHVARGPAGVLGVQVCLALPGATGLLWPPQASGHDPDLEDRLVRHALDGLRRRGVTLAQAILTDDEVEYAVPLLRNGFLHTTTLDYLHRAIDEDAPPRASGLDLQHYSSANADLFNSTLLLTYVGALDCPELTGVRPVEDIIAGHQAHGRYDPQRWWLALENGRPVGVLLLNALDDWASLDIAYLGVVPAARGRGVGRTLTAHALAAAREAGVLRLTLAVDRRNLPARNLYARFGFEPFDARAVFLAFLPRPS